MISREKNYVMERAEEIQAYLGNKFLTCVKPMLPSHVSGGFWLGLPRKFYHLHLPNHDAIIILVDETEKEYQVVYIAERTGLSGRWRGFSIEHRLLEQDALVFQLIEPDKLKIYIVRANRLSETDGALGLMHLSHAKRTDFGQNVPEAFSDGSSPID
ncbi:hypothetical protein BDE02_04G123300 [Populus trichocarpa]|nr:hypothetical protein BDE02_04G123300 [Populus trichocarpa]KAI5592024.1 hypothetical protein BDE02_04G123300 [Populus trichocarpa]